MAKTAKKQKVTHRLFAWLAANGRFYWSLRPVNNPKNASEDNDYRTAGGRNKMINKLLARYPEGAVQVLRNTDPKVWLKQQKKKVKK